jgi:glycosyl hydrolase family 113
MTAKEKTGPKTMAGMKNVITAVVGVAVIAGAVLGIKFFAGGGKPPLEFQKGMGYCSWSKTKYVGARSDKSLEALKATGTDHVAILVTWYQTNCWSGDIKRMGTTPSDEAVVHAIRKAHELGMKVMLKPHLDLIDKSDGSWRGEISCLKESAWESWFNSYTDFIMHYVEIAKKEKVELICVGTELSTAATTKGYFWKVLIRKIRKQYSGLLTYAAHWDRYQDIRFWDALDYVGINAYFPLSEEMSPTYDQLKDGWTKWVIEMEEFQARVQKPIIFPEIGCNSCDGAAIRPWEHAPRREINLELQANYYKVLMDIFFEKEWFYGQYWWYWETNSSMGGSLNRSFTPQNKPAEKVVKEGYARSVSR